MYSRYLNVVRTLKIRLAVGDRKELPKGSTQLPFKTTGIWPLTKRNRIEPAISGVRLYTTLLKRPSLPYNLESRTPVGRVYFDGRYHSSYM